MQEKSVGAGLLASAALAIPIGFIDFFLASDYSIGNWAVLCPIFPYAVYFGTAAILGRQHDAELGKGLPVGGAVFSTLIVVGIISLGIVFGVATEP